MDIYQNRISNKWADLYFDNGVLVAQYKPRAYVDLEAALIMLKDREELCQGIKVPGLADSRQGFYWTKESRMFMASEENNRLLSCVSMLIQSPIIKTLANYYMYFDKPVIPTKVFTNYKQAHDWAMNFKENQK